MEYEQIQGKLSNPSPVMQIDVFNPSLNDKNVKAVNAVVDTGAGMTCLPKSVIEKLGKLEYTENYVGSPVPGNKPTKEKFYRVRLGFQNGKTYKSYEIEVIEIPRKYGIIGRDILNYYKIVLNAPLTKWGMDCSCEEGGCILSKSE
jgi:predicted aspartyl protease